MTPNDKRGWDIATAASMIPAQTKLFAELTATLGPDKVVLAKETGGGAAFTDWTVANAAMTTDTFCSNYQPRSSVPAPESHCGDGRWSIPVRGHSPGTPEIAKVNVSTIAQCQEICCSTKRCESVLFNSQALFCILMNRSYNANFICMNGFNNTKMAVEWLSNKAGSGENSRCPNPSGRWNDTTLWNASQCRVDMETVVAAAARRQLTESHGQGPIDPKSSVSDQEAAREFALAAFLVAAGNFSYFSYAGWAHGQAWSLSGTRWWPEYDRPLGAPIDPPMHPVSGVLESSMQYMRRFSSGTWGEVDLVAHTGKIHWIS